VARTDTVLVGDYLLDDATATFAENDTGTAFQGVSTGLGGTITYTLTGADAALFDVSSTGAVTFKAAPNFESAADAGATTSTTCVWLPPTASTPPEQDAAITVTDVNDAPALTAPQAVLAAGTEDTAYTVSAAELLQGYSDADGDTLSVGTVTSNRGPVTDNGDGTDTVTPTASFNCGAVTLSYSADRRQRRQHGGDPWLHSTRQVDDAPTALALPERHRCRRKPGPDASVVGSAASHRRRQRFGLYRPDARQRGRRASTSGSTTGDVFGVGELQPARF